MRGQKYRARDKKVRKMSRDGLLEENLHSRDSVRISQRERDALELSRADGDSVDLQNIRRHRTDGRAEEGNRRRRRAPGPAGSKQKETGNTSDDFLLEDFADSEWQDASETGGRTEETLPEVPSYRTPAKTVMHPEAGDQQETGRRQRKRKRIQQESRLNLKPEIQVNTESHLRPKMQTESGLYQQMEQSSESAPEVFSDFPDSEKDLLKLESASDRKLSRHPLRMKQIREDAPDRRKTSAKALHNRRKKQVYEYARKQKEKKAAEELQRSVSERENLRYERNRNITEKLRDPNGGRLSFRDKEKGMVYGAGIGITKKVLSAPARKAADELHKKEHETEQENTAAESVHRTELAGEKVLRCGMRASSLVIQRQRFQKAGMSGDLERKRRLRFEEVPGDKKTFRTSAAKRKEAEKRAVRKHWQKQRIKKSYQAAKRGQRAAGEITKATETVFEKTERVVKVFFQKNKGIFVTFSILGLLIVLISSELSSCGAMIQGISSSVIGTTYPSTDADIHAVDADYVALENALDQQINNMETTHPGYDEYRYQVEEISHNPYHLISYLTVIYQEFTYDQVKGALAGLFSEQFRLTVEEIVETRTRTETHTSTDPVTGETSEYEVEVEYDYYILCISLTNRGFDAVARSHLTAEQTELYMAYNQTFGNRNYLFDIHALPPEVSGIPGDPGYEIPPEELSDARFANMIREAEKYLGYPYVWGGASPSTSFDCSGFVCWVINHCGNGWDVGRTTAEGLRQHCSYVSPSEARPGDLIFFQGTYNTSGASHVGIYVGNNRMIHCGSPIQYTSTNSRFWTVHFLSYGRIP